MSEKIKAAIGSKESGSIPITTCAGRESLCTKRYDQVTFLVAHNAYAIEGVYKSPNQDLTIAEQLRLGVRGFMLDVYLDPTTKRLALCHSDCSKGSAPYDATLDLFRSFLETHRDEILTLIVEDHTSNQLINAALDASGLRPFVYVLEHGKTWPMLGEMVASNRRLVVFTEDKLGDSHNADTHERFAGYHIAYDQMWDTPYGEIPAEDAAEHCPLLRGRRTHPLFLINHFITKRGVDRDARKQANDVLARRVSQCARELGRAPNFLAVDWVGYSSEKLRALVEGLNSAPQDGIDIL